MSMNRKVAGGLVVLSCIAGCVALVGWMQWCPSIKGVVLDKETGKPVAGAEIVRIGQGPLLLSAESHVFYDSEAGSARTDAQGRFQIKGTARNAGGSFVTLPPGWVSSVALNVYAEDYIPAEIHENVWGEHGQPPRYTATGGGWEEASSGQAVVKRRRSFFRGYQYVVELVKPKSEEDWQEKCRITTLFHDLYVPREFSDRWLFNDLTGYLERWPEGEKAGEYLGMAMFTALVAHEQSKNPGREEERRFHEEDAKLLNLALSAQKSTGHNGYNMYGWEENLPLVKAEYQELSRILGRGEGK